MPERLAIDGGTPVRKTMLPYGHQVVDEHDMRAVVDVLRGDWLTTGPTVQAYEKAFAQYVGATHAVAVSSGTAALHAAAFAAGIKEDDEVITSPLSFVASANCICYCGGRPVFADVEPDTCLIDPEQVDSLIDECTRAIIPVDYTGQPAGMEAIMTLAKRHRLVVIEDAAHSLGAKYYDYRVGQIAHMTAFSTHPVKAITTGEGGMVTTNDDQFAERLRAFRNHGINVDAEERARRGDWHYEMRDLGRNYRIPDILCALGLSQLRKLDDWLRRRTIIAQRYNQAFAELPEVEPIAIRPGRTSAWHLYVIRLNLKRLRDDRKQVFKALRAEGIGVNVHYIPIPWHPYYRNLGYRDTLCPEAGRQYTRLLTLPLWHGMGDKDVEDVIAAVRKVVEFYRRPVT